MTRLAPARYRSIRLARNSLVILLTALLADRLLIQGLLLPVRIHGGSMAPSLLGRHFLYTCHACRYSFPIDEVPPPGVVCPNCGTVHRGDDEMYSPISARPGQRVLLDRLSLRIRNPQRWEVIAFRRADAHPSVKRVIGLPGERVTIHAGDVWVNDQVVRKPLAVLQSMLVHVHADVHRIAQPADDDSAFRWGSEGDGSSPISGSGRNVFRWQPTAIGYGLSAGLGRRQPDWLIYQHLACLPPPLRRKKKPVFDSYGYNQNLSRSLQTITDVVLECDIAWSGRGPIRFRFLAAGEPIEILWAGDGRLILSRDGQKLRATNQSRSTTGTAAVILGYADLHAFLGFDGQIAIDHRIDPSLHHRRSESSQTRPFAIGGQDVDLNVTNLHVLRDVYYLAIPGKTQKWQLGNEQFLLLGDNSPISEDARHGDDYGVITTNQIMGRLVPQRIRPSQ